MSTKSGSLSIVCIQLGLQKLSLYKVAGCPLFRGCLSTDVNGRTEMNNDECHVPEKAVNMHRV